MPAKRFWFYNKQVDRLAAEEDLRMINLLASVTSGDAYGKATENLRKQMGEIVVLVPVSSTLIIDDGKRDPQFDRAAFLALKVNAARPKR